MEFTISWIEQTGAKWAPAAGAVEALTLYLSLNDRGCDHIEVKTGDGTRVSLRQLRLWARREKGFR